MKKHSLTIHGLKNHSPAQRGRLVEYLANRFQLSPDLIAIKLKSFPVTFKDWIDDEIFEDVQSELEELGVLAAFDEGERLAKKAAEEQTPAAEQNTEDAPDEDAESDETPETEAASEEPNLDLAPEETSETEPVADQSSDLKGAGLSFDEEAADLASLKDAEVSGDSKRLDVPAGLDLSFDAQSTVEHSTEEEAQIDSAAKEDAAAAKPSSAISFSADDSVEEESAEEVVEVADQPESSSSELVTSALKAAAEAEGESANQAISDDELDSLFKEIEDSPEPPPTVSSAKVEKEPRESTLQPPQAAAPTPPAPGAVDDDELDFDDEEFEEIYYTPLLSRPIIWVIGCALVVGAALIGFTMGGGPDTTPEISISGETATRLLNEQKAILVVKKPTHAGMLSKHRKVWSGSLDENGVKTDVKLTALKGDIVDIVIDISTPPPPKLSPKELVAGKAQPVWLNRFEINRLEHYETFDANDPSKSTYPVEQFSLRTKGKAYMRDHAGRGRRIVAPILIEGSLSADGSTIKGTWKIANGAPGEPVLPPNSAKFLGGKSYRLFYSSPFRAKLVESEEENEENSENAQEEKQASDTEE